MVVLFGLLAALAFALGTVLQQKGTLEAPATERDPRFLVQILRRPVWLAGAASQATGWVLQAAALDRGSLVVVQSLTATSLVIALPLGARLTGQHIDRRTGLAALATVLGILLFLSVGTPQGGTAHPDAAAWWSAALTAAVVIGILASLGRGRSSATRALFFGSAAGVGFALQSSVTKEFTTVLGNGLVAILSSWTVYVLILSAIVGFALQQLSAQDRGPGTGHGLEQRCDPVRQRALRHFDLRREAVQREHPARPGDHRPGAGAGGDLGAGQHGAARARRPGDG